jgi:predicted NBD/HSP70 family sugar kinase
VVLGSEIFRGAAGFAGEIGHLTLDDQGPMCRCGSRGCLEAYASIGAILDLMAGQHPDAELDDIIAAAGEGSFAARRTFEDAGLHLGWGLASIVNLVNPDVVVVGGDLALAGDLVLDATRVGLRRHALADAADTPVVVSALGRRASLVGGVLLASDGTDVLA